MFFNNHHIIYNQTWEDPSVDAEGLKPVSEDIIVCISSAGCNVLNLSLNKSHIIYAVDKNYAQHALLRLKLAGIAGLNCSQFWAMFGEADLKSNIVCYTKYIRDRLNTSEKIYWDKHIRLFSSGFYHVGKLRTLFLLRKWIRYLCGEENIEEFVNAKDIKTQHYLYYNKIRPGFWNPVTQYIPVATMFLYGVSLRQISRSLASGRVFLKDIFTDRLDNLFTRRFIGNNFFWQRVFLGKYKSNSICPPYLQKQNFDTLKRSVKKIRPCNVSIIDFLRTCPDSSVTKFNLSDVPEFLNSKDQFDLWREVGRTGKNNGLILYRSFSPNFLIPKAFSRTFIYVKEISEYLTEVEMTGSYSGVYIYKIYK